MSKTKIVLGIISAALAYDCKVAYRNSKLIDSLKDDNKRLRGKVNYLASKLDRYEVPLEEFDDLVLKYYRK